MRVAKAKRTSVRAQGAVLRVLCLGLGLAACSAKQVSPAAPSAPPPLESTLANPPSDQAAPQSETNVDTDVTTQAEPEQPTPEQPTPEQPRSTEVAPSTADSPPPPAPEASRKRKRPLREGDVDDLGLTLWE